MVTNGEGKEESMWNLRLTDTVVSTLCDPMDCSLSGSSVHGIFQARVLEWIAISFSKGSSRPRNQTRVSSIAGRFFTSWATILHSTYVHFKRSICLTQTVKHLPAMRETRVRFLGREDPLEKEMAIHSSTLAWRIPWTEEPDRLQSMGHKESDTTEWLHFTFTDHYKIKKEISRSDMSESHLVPSLHGK